MQDINPPRGEKRNFRKVTFTLPPKTYEQLIQESAPFFKMNSFVAVSILAAAALLGAGGDAILGAGLKSGATSPRLSLSVPGAVVLFTYGWVVNAPPSNFGQLLG